MESSGEQYRQQHKITSDELSGIMIWGKKERQIRQACSQGLTNGRGNDKREKYRDGGGGGGRKGRSGWMEER